MFVSAAVRSHHVAPLRCLARTLFTHQHSSKDDDVHSYNHRLQRHYSQQHNSGAGPVIHGAVLSNNNSNYTPLLLQNPTGRGVGLFGAPASVLLGPGGSIGATGSSAAGRGGGGGGGASRPYCTPAAGGGRSLGTTEDQDNIPSDKSILKSMLVYLWPAGNPALQARVAGALSLLVLAKVANVQAPFFFKWAVDELGQSGVPEAVASDSVAMLASTGALLVGYGLARTGASAFGELRNVLFAKVAQNSIRQIARRTFLHLLTLDLNFHLSRQVGSLSRAIDRGTRSISFLLSSMIFNVFPTALEVSMVAGLLAYNCGPEFAAVTVGCVASYSAFTFYLSNIRVGIRRKMNQADNEAGQKSMDALLNYETVKYFGNEKYETDGYDRSLEKYESAAIKTTNSLALLNWGQNLIFSVSLTAVMLMASDAIQKGTMSVGDLVMVNGLLFQLSVPLNFLGTVYRENRQALIDMGTLFKLIESNAGVQDSPGAKELFLHEAACPKGTKDLIKVENVAFQYDGGREIFKDLSFTIEPGTKVAIVGPSGCGKSTVLRLLFRFYDPDSGSITYGGEDIRNVTLESLRRHVGVVPQDCVLFNKSIRHNIAYGKLDATDEEVENAARMADVHDAIMQMPDGYGTVVGERGLKISGGEKQRLAIARTILKNPEIVFYDEATSSLDSVTESHILQALRKVTANRTSVVIAHRLSTVIDADKILVLDQGEIVEQGRHEELLAKQGLYAELWDNQTRLAGNAFDDDDVDKLDQPIA